MLGAKPEGKAIWGENWIPKSVFDTSRNISNGFSACTDEKLPKQVIFDDLFQQGSSKFQHVLWFEAYQFTSLYIWL